MSVVVGAYRAPLLRHARERDVLGGERGDTGTFEHDGGLPAGLTPVRAVFEVMRLALVFLCSVGRGVTLNGFAEFCKRDVQCVGDPPDGGPGRVC